MQRKLFPTDSSFSQHAPVGFCNMNMLQHFSGIDNGVIKIIFLNIHMKGIKVKEEIVFPCLLNKLQNIFCRITDIGFVAVNRFYGDLYIPGLGIICHIAPYFSDDLFSLSVSGFPVNTPIPLCNTPDRRLVSSSSALSIAFLISFSAASG